MDKVVVGQISPEGEQILRSYMEAFLPNAEIEPLNAVGIKGRIKSRVARADTVLLIIDEALVGLTEGVVDKELANPKVHKYVTDDGLRQFLISKFGRLKNGTGVVPPDVLLKQQSESHVDFGSSSQNDDSSAEIKELKSKLATSELMVHNLQLQLTEQGKSSDEDIAAFVARIKELESQLNGMGSGVGNAELRAQLRELGDERADLQHEVTVLKASLAKAESEASSLRTNAGDIASMRTELNEKSTKLREITMKLSEYEDDVAAKAAEIESLQADIKLLRDKISENNAVSENLSNVSAKLREKEMEFVDLQEEYATAKRNIDQLQTTVDSQKQELEELRGSLQSKTDENTAHDEEQLGKIAELESKVRESEQQLSTLTAEYNSYKDIADAKVAEMTAQLTANETELNSYCQRELEYKSTIRSLKSDASELAVKDSEVSMLTLDLEEQKQLVSTLSATVQRLKDQSVETENTIRELKMQAVQSKDEAEINKKAYDDVLVERKDLEDKLIALTNEHTRLSETLTEYEEELKSVKDANAVLTEEKFAVESETRKLSAKLTAMETEVIDSKANEDTVRRLENDLLEERRNSTRLAAEIEVLRKNSESTSSADLRIEISRLQNELDNARDEVEAKSGVEITTLKEALAESRSRCAELELDMADLDAQVEELSNGAFGRLAALAIPKAVYDVSLEPLQGNYSKFLCIASGSMESNYDMYENLALACQSAKKRILILDINGDSKIDNEFQVTKCQTPLNWLAGADGFKSYLARTKMPNVIVMTTALAYINDLFLMNVNWQKRLAEIGDFGDLCIISIGCLNNLVTKVLFNTFGSVMRTLVVSKATPINIRSTILNLTGLRKDALENTSVSCVKYNDAARSLYERLASKYNASILREKEVLTL